jgi:hypothetical protein
MKGVAGDGESIICEDNDGLRAGSLPERRIAAGERQRELELR